MKQKNRKSEAAKLSILSNSTLIILKITAGILSGSISIISEAIHSGMDLAAAVIAYFSVGISSKPADVEHPYGHGKIESISGLIEGALIFFAAGIIMKEAIDKIVNPTEINQTSIAVAVMLFSGFLNFLVSKKLYRVSKAEDSLALEADALHLKTDVYTSLGVAVGLLLVNTSNITILDPVIALLVALLIIKEALNLCSKALKTLLDCKLTDEEECIICNIIEEYQNVIIDFHQLRTRKSGNIKYIDFHLTVDKKLSVEESHKICELIETALDQSICNTNVNIHVEPD